MKERKHRVLPVGIYLPCVRSHQTGVSPAPLDRQVCKLCVREVTPWPRATRTGCRAGISTLARSRVSRSLLDCMPYYSVGIVVNPKEPDYSHFEMACDANALRGGDPEVMGRTTHSTRRSLYNVRHSMEEGLRGCNHIFGRWLKKRLRLSRAFTTTATASMKLTKG